MTDSEDRTGEILRDLLGRFYVLNRMAAAGQAEVELSPSYFRTLGILVDRGPQRIGDLAAAVHVSQPAMTKIVHALEGMNAVSRSTDPADSRASLVTLTDAGRALLARRSEEVLEHLLPRLGQFSPQELDTLARTVAILDRHVPTD